ncbi:MAG TPA: IS21 family transposase [Candidatus Acidoferrum sp.]|nr:IS21 family transposase [Candidatus Acidoferrum sp.]
MSNVLSDEKKQQVIALGKLGWSLRQIEQATGVRRETASVYLKTAGVVVCLPGWGRRARAKPAIQVTTDPDTAKPAIGVTTDPDPPKPAMQVTTDSGPPRGRSTSACAPYRELIEQGLDRGRNAMAIWQDLVSDHGFAGGYQTVKRFVRKIRGSELPQAVGIILTKPGEEAQVDYGRGPMVRDPQSGKYRRTRLFVMTLGYSRKSVRLLTWRSSTRIWAELHEKAFRRLGACPRVMILDNLGEGVLVPDVYDPTLNPLYRDVLAHYGVVALPCRVRDPDRKGKVESGVGHAKKTPLKGMRFESLEEAQAYLDRWEERWADTRIHGTTKRQVAAMFAEEKPHLLPLPLEPFRYYQYGERVVHLDGCVEVEAAYYGLPPGWIGRSVKVQWDELHVRILHPTTNQLLREHLRQKRGGYRIQEEDHPKKMPLSTAQLLRRAEHAGTKIGKFCQLIHQQQGETGIRRILGVLSLTKKYGTAAVEDACAAALDIGVHEYRFVRRYLERRPHQQMFLRQIDPLIRRLTEYRDFVNLKTKEQPE